MDNGKVRFRWKDYRDGNRQKTMTLRGDEFIRRFLIHVLPDGFHRIRYYGFLGNHHRTRKLALCRALIGMAPPVRHRAGGGLSSSVRGADRAVLAQMSALRRRHHGGDRLRHACSDRPRTAGYVMTLGQRSNRIALTDPLGWEGDGRPRSGDTCDPPAGSSSCPGGAAARTRSEARRALARTGEGSPNSRPDPTRSGKTPIAARPGGAA